MHPDLQLKRLRELPIAFRGIAQSAASGSTPDMTKLFILVRQIGKAQALCTLPAFYPQLHPAKIPDVDTGISEEGRTAVKNAFIALQAMTWFVIGDGLPDPLAIEFWPKIWKWIEFIWMYPSLVIEVFLPDDPGKHSPRYYASAACVCFAHVPRIASLVTSTPGYWLLLAEHWGNVLLPLRHESEEDLFVRVCETVERLNCGFISEENFHSMMDGAGGTLFDLASLIVQHMTMITRDFRLPVPEIAGRLFMSGLVFLTHVSEFDPRIIDAVLRQGIVVDILKAYHTLAVPPPSVQQGLFLALKSLFASPPGYPWIIQALDAGLLRAILGAGKMTGVDHTQLKYILRVNLPGSTVYYSVLAQLQTSLADTDSELKNMLPNLVPDVRTQYTTFLRLALERIAFKKEYDLPHLASYVACDNMNCGKIDVKSNFRRCSGCRQRLYCCSKCQALDWNVADGHRAYCGRLAPGAKLYIEPDGRLKTTAGEPDLSKRDTSFLRALVHHDYRNMRQIIRTQQMLQDSHTACFTYIKKGMDGHIDASAGIDSTNAVQMQQVAWPHEMDWQARLKRGGGRVDIHFVFVSEGYAMRIHLIPLRSSHGAISHSLDQLSRTLPVGTNMEQLMYRFPRIFEEAEHLLNTDVVEIH
ncbi:hypothetical protein C8R47DRAFT_1202414 [Mycena vitilis]|nr:hypothetical protein C8R47DRAFT_1202414 [Mycena vitilis]